MKEDKRTAVFRIDPARPDREAIEYCAGVLRRGGLVAFPTETVYGIAADLSNKRAMARLRRVKNRPRGKPFTVHIASRAMIKRMGGIITKDAARLMDKFWPGPLTLILKARSGGTIGFRMPENAAALRLIEASRVGVVAPSANMSGANPPTTGRAVLAALDGKIDALLDAGRTKVGVESTVVEMSSGSPRVLREGAIKRERILKVIDG